MAIFDVVKFDGLKSKDWIVYKFPADQLVIGTQLIVNEGQVALFVKGGEVCDVFYPGTVTLDSNNLPILHKLVNLPFGGNTPFSAEIYFINTKTKLDINWGTSDPIQLIDPKYSVKLRIRAYGQMGLKLKDAELFFKELIGSINQSDVVSYEKLAHFYRGLIVLKAKTCIAETILSGGISALEISSKLEEISNTTKERITTEFEKYGFNVVNFYVQSINFPDEDFDKINKILESKAAFDIMGDSRYVTKRSFDVYEGAANNENGVAGVFAAGGLGIGAASAINQNFAREEKLMSVATKVCPKCQKENATNAKFCSECGTNIGIMKCVCGMELVAGSKFCSSCGKPVE